MNKKEVGRLGAKKLWDKFRSNKRFRENLLYKWSKKGSSPKVMAAVRKASKAGVIARKKQRRKKFNEEVTDLKKKLKKTKFRLLKAKLCGFLMGDGNVTKDEIRFFPDDLSIAKHFEEAFLALYKKKPKIKRYKNYFRIRIRKKSASIDMLRSSRFGIVGWAAPSNLLNTDEMKKEWLRAFFDCEASVSKRQIQLQSVNKWGIYQIKNLLSELGIESGVYSYKRKNKNWRTNYLLCIMKKAMIKKYVNLIGFNHRFKSEKLQNLICQGA